MNARTILSGAVLVLATAAITSQVTSQEAKQPPEMPPEMMEMMEKMTAAGTPGDNHKLIGHKEGSWNGAIKMWWMPDAPPESSTCTTESKWILNGHYMLETVSGNFNGESFEGHSLVGFDNVTGKFFSLWIDSMSTSAMYQEGSYDSVSKTFKYGGEMSCPMTGKRVKGRTVERWIDENSYVMEMYGPWYKTGKEYKTMEITYTRAK